MSKKLNAGQQISFETKTIHGEAVFVPSKDASFVHLQFRRFAGCPICNLHLQSFVQRDQEIKNASIKEVVFFHSSDEELLPYQGNFPFAVIGDPEKKFYERFGVESSLSAILNPGAWGAMVKGNLAKSKPSMPMMPKGGPLGLPADFLITADGTIKAVHYGKHADDQWSVDQLLATARQLAA